LSFRLFVCQFVRLLLLLQLGVVGAAIESVLLAVMFECCDTTTTTDITANNSTICSAIDEVNCVLLTQTQMHKQQTVKSNNNNKSNDR